MQDMKLKELDFNKEIHKYFNLSKDITFFFCANSTMTRKDYLELVKKNGIDYKN